MDVKVNISDRNSIISSKNTFVKSIKRHKELSNFKKNVAVLSPPTVVAGSSCGSGIVNLSATGAVGETIEWYSSQTAAVPCIYWK